MQLGKQPRGRQGGFTLIAVLAALALLAVATERIAFIASHQAQRDREDELLRRGAELARAIGSYYESSPGSVKTFPRELAHLVEDPRFLSVKRHLRRVYSDPINGGDWQVVRDAGGAIIGVHSTSALAPIRTAAIDLDGLEIPPASRYADWQFTYTPKPAGTGGQR